MFVSSVYILYTIILNDYTTLLYNVTSAFN